MCFRILKRFGLHKLFVSCWLFLGLSRSVCGFVVIFSGCFLQIFYEWMITCLKFDKFGSSRLLKQIQGQDHFSQAWKGCGSWGRVRGWAVGQEAAEGCS